MELSRLNFAQNYGESAYGSCAYGELTATATCATGANPSGDGSTPLADTGIWLLLVVSASALIVFVALAVRFSRRSRTRSGDHGPTQS